MPAAAYAQTASLEGAQGSAVDSDEAEGVDPPSGSGLARRALPDYDGRPEPDADDADTLVWIPRILTTPLYLISEYALRRPLTWLLTEIEQSDVFEALFDVFVFGPERNIGVLPTAFFDFGLSPSVGIYAFWNHFIVDANRISVQGATWGEDWLSLVAVDSVTLRDDLKLAFRFAAVRRPDQQFGGIGYDALSAVISRYGIEQIDGSVVMTMEPWRRSQLRYEVGYRGVGFSDAPFMGDPSVGTVYPQSVRPPAFDTGYSALRAGARFVVDSRESNGELSSGGVRVGAHVEANLGFGGLSASRWFRWGGELHLSTDFLGRGRVIGIQLVVDMVSALDGAIVPFTELFELGGTTGPLTGFQPGLVRGKSIGAVVADYVWPIWAFLDGRIHVAVGNAFDEHFQDFDAERLRMSFGIGLAPRISGEHFFELGVGIGTATFENGAEVQSVRFVVGGGSGL